MIATAELRRIADAKLADAVDLYRLGRYDSSIYLCGYAVELALKARICDTLGWAGYPEARGEFRDLQSFRTHDLRMLLHLSGIEVRIDNEFPNAWEAVETWRPEWRYLPVGKTDEGRCSAMLGAVAILMGEL